MTTNHSIGDVIPFRVVGPLSHEVLVQRTRALQARIDDNVRRAYLDYESWIELSAELATVYAEARALCGDDDRAFGRYLDDSGLNALNAHDRAALVAFGLDVERFRAAARLSSRQRRSYQLLHIYEWTQTVPSVSDVIPDAISASASIDTPRGVEDANRPELPVVEAVCEPNAAPENAPRERNSSGMLERGMGAEGLRLRAIFLAANGQQSDTFDVLHKIMRKYRGKQALRALLKLMEENPHWKPTTGGKTLSLRMLHRDASFYNCSGARTYEGENITPANLLKVIRHARERLQRGYGLPEGQLPPPIDSLPVRGSAVRVRDPAAVAAEMAALQALVPPNPRHNLNGDCPADGPWLKPADPRYTPASDEEITVNGVVVREVGARPNLYHYEWRTLQFLPFLFDVHLRVHQDGRSAVEAYNSSVDACRLMFCGFLEDIGLPDLAAALRSALVAARNNPGPRHLLQITKAPAVLRLARPDGRAM